MCMSKNEKDNSGRRVRHNEVSFGMSVPQRLAKTCSEAELLRKMQILRKASIPFSHAYRHAHTHIHTPSLAGIRTRRKWIGWVDECWVHQWVSPHFPHGFACPNAFSLMCTGFSAAFEPLGATHLWIILPQSQTEFEVFTPRRTVRDRSVAVHASKLLT